METITQNTLRAIRFEWPAHIPMVFWINPSCWHHYLPEVQFELMADHPLLFPDFAPGRAAITGPAPWQRADLPHKDAWGCPWQTADDGITGTVTQHPLADWADLASFVPPDPARTNAMSEIGWAVERHRAEQAARAGFPSSASLEHGHTFQSLGYLRGYEYLLLDVADGDVRLDGLVDMVEALGHPEGGLMMIYGLYPGVPVENVRAVMDAMERYAGFYA